MVDTGFCEVPMLPAGSDALLPEVSPAAEAALIISWNKEVERAARRVARFTDRGGADDADDVAQNIRIRLLEAYRTFNGAPPTPYVRRLLKNTAINATRDDQHRLTLHNDAVAFSLDDENWDLAGLTENSEALPEDLVVRPRHHDVLLEATVRRWVATLPHSLRVLYRSLYVEDRKMSEVALALGVTPARVSQLHRYLIARGEIASIIW